MKRVLVARQDNNGDVLLTGPAVRAIAASGAEITFLSGPRGAAAARMLPGVRRAIVREAEWIDALPQRVDAESTLRFVRDLRRHAFEEAAIFTSFHQSALPLALLLRLAGVPRIGAISTDYPGSLLDVRHNVDDDIHEVTRALSLAAAMGYQLPLADDGRLRVSEYPRYAPLPAEPFIVVHPGATVPARAWFPDRNAALVERLCDQGHRVVVTGAASERELTRFVAGSNGIDLGGATSFEQFVSVINQASAVICGNTAAAHVAAATGTPVVSIFAPTIPAVRFHPWMVPYVTLGDQHAPCAGCRSRVCPIEGQPCLDVDVETVIAALHAVERRRPEAA